MPTFDAKVEQMKRILGRALTVQELRLVRQWDDLGSTEEFAQAALQGAGGDAQEQEYEGRFKIAYSGGQFDIYFVCSTVTFRPVSAADKEDVLAFLTQDPIRLDAWLVEQAITGAQHLKPTQIAQSVVVADVVLRSMGFLQR
jgi:hypothetical protein